MATEKESVIVSSAFMFIRCTRALIRKYQKKNGGGARAPEAKQKDGAHVQPNRRLSITLVLNPHA